MNRRYDGRVPAEKLAALMAVFFLTSVLSVITGSTSLITVPAMIAFGIEAHTAVATNMLALTFMSAGGSLPFLRRGVVSSNSLPANIVLTVLGSAAGALLLLSVPVRTLQIFIAVAMIAIAIFSIQNRAIGMAAQTTTSPAKKSIGYMVTFALAVYGGFFSGGYVTLLTTAFVLFFGMTFLQAIATTKVINIFSSGVATLIFLRQGIVDVRLGIILGLVMFLGALLGGRIALRLSAVWTKRIFIGAVLVLALKMLWPVFAR